MKYFLYKSGGRSHNITPRFLDLDGQPVGLYSKASALS